MHARTGAFTLIAAMMATQIGCSQSPTDPAANGVYEGTLYFVSGDGPDHRREDRFVLVTESGSFTIAADEPATRALRGRERDHVAIRAERDGARLHFRALEDEPASGLGQVEQAEWATPRSGNWRFLVLSCHFSDWPAPSPTRQATVAGDIGKDSYPGVSHYFRSGSRNTFNTSGAVAHPNVIQLFAPSSDDRYWSKDANGNRTGLDWYWAIPQECMAIARNQGVNFASYRGIAFVLDDGLLGGWAWGGGYSDGLSALWIDTATNNLGTLIHEIGHGLGFNHLGTWADPFYYLPFNRKENTWCNYASFFDPMGSGGCTDRNDPACYSAHLAAFHKEALGWMGGQTATAPKGQSQYPVTRADNTTGSLAMIRVPIAGTRSFTIETRKKNGTNFDGTPSYDALVPREGVILHHMEPWAGYWEAVLIDPDHDCDSRDVTTVFTPGETFRDASGFSMTVTGSQTSGYLVSIWRPYTLALNVGTGGYVVAESGGKAQVCKAQGTCELPYPKNATVKLTAVGLPGSFSGWTGCPQPSGSTCTFTHGTYDRTIGASFTCPSGSSCGAAVASSLAITKGGTGGGRVLASHFDCGAQCSGSVPFLDVVQLMAIPDPGSSFVRWEGACAGTTSSCDVVASGAKSVRAVFDVPVLVPTNLTATPGPGRVTLNWSPVTGATNYRVFSGTSPGAYTWNWTTGGATTSIDWADWATLYYVVKAVLPSGETPASAEVSARGWSNLSRGKAASQKTNYSPTLGLAGLAVDGNYDGDFSHGSVTSTSWGDQQWWQVDLGATRTLKEIHIYNRSDCCSDALSSFDVSTSTDGVTWTVRRHFSGQAGSPTALSLSSVSGRYVRIQLAAYATAVLLAEVDVWGY